jgi:hypothetical protein
VLLMTAVAMASVGGCRVGVWLQRGRDGTERRWLKKHTKCQSTQEALQESERQICSLDPTFTRILFLFVDFLID